MLGLIEIALKQDLVLLDFETNSDIENIRKPLSHAALIKKFIDKKYPELLTKRFSEFDNSKKKSSRTKNKKGIKPSDESQLTMNF